MADLGHEPAIDPPSVYDREDTVDCPECGAELEVSAGSAYCESCDYVVDEDGVRDQLEAAHEPPEWA
jgi:hypothetical protein